MRLKIMFLQTRLHVLAHLLRVSVIVLINNQLTLIIFIIKFALIKDLCNIIHAIYIYN